ncbi:hypothetical protein ANTPLA_LOCUS7581 [Anthophora plagiata]
MKKLFCLKNCPNINKFCKNHHKLFETKYMHLDIRLNLLFFNNFSKLYNLNSLISFTNVADFSITISSFK